MCAALHCHCSWQVNRKIAIKVIRKCNYVTKLSLLISIKNDKNWGNKIYSFAFSIRTGFPVGWYRRGQVMCFNRHGHAGIHTEWSTRSKGDAFQKVRRNFHFPRKYYFWWRQTVLFICKAMSFIWFLAGENYFRSLTWKFLLLQFSVAACLSARAHGAVCPRFGQRWCYLSWGSSWRTDETERW